MPLSNKKKLRNLLKALDPKEEVSVDLAEMRDEVNTILGRPREVIVREKPIVIEGEPGKPGETPSDTKLRELIKPLIPEPIKGKDAVVDIKGIMGSILSRIPHGGNANRNIAIGGNGSVLSRYTDINLKAGANTTITYTNNDVTKFTDITFASTGGGGGSVSGIVRSVQRISASQAADAVTGTDYVYIAIAGLALTLPDAVGNTNLYSVKNVAASSVLVATTGGQTIDGDTEAVLRTQYTEITLHNDGNDNWSIGV